MENKKDTRMLLELLPQPAFCVRDGVICHCNHGASQLFIQPNTPVAVLLGDTAEEYAQLQDGSMYLTLHLGEQTAAATVTRTEELDLFVLDTDPAKAELKSMALSAVHLREPLSNIATLLRHAVPPSRDGEDAAGARYAAKLEQQLNQLRRMVCNMSDASRYAAEPQPRKTVMNLDSVVAELAEKVQTLSAGQGLTLRCSLPNGTLPAPMERERLERAIYNLISNAMKVTKPGGTIDITLTRRKNRAYLSVRDYGPGIPDSQMGSIFSRFTRQPGLEDPTHGIGLGLSLVCSAAITHGGTVLLDRPEGGGTRFTMSISLRPEEVRDTLLQAAPPAFDYAGEQDHALQELSDVLPPEVYLS